VKEHLVNLRTLAFYLFIFGVANSLHADLPSIRFDRLRPLGASAGTEVDAEIAGSEIDAVKSLMFDHPGFKAQQSKEKGKERWFKISIAKDVPPGTYDVRLVGRWGVSNPRLFAVTYGLTDVSDKEPNNDAATAQVVLMNSAINGDSDGNGQDVFRFSAKQNQRVVIDCQAGKLDSQIDATMFLSSVEGKLLAANSDYNGRDPLIDFVAPTDGEFLVTLHDLSYRGGQPYRLIITDRAHVENVFPRAVQLGKSVDLIAFGRNLGQGSSPSKLILDDKPLDQLSFQVTAPADVFALRSYRFFEHPSDHSVLPTAATCTMTGFQARPKSSSIAQTVLTVDGVVTIEAEPNDSSEKPQQVTLPLVVSGRFDKPRDGDWFEFDVPENGQYSFEVYCERIAGRADPYLVVMDDKGNRVSELDDFGHRINAFDGHLRDPSGMVNLTGKRKYRVLVQDRYRRGGARYHYVLKIRKPIADFYAAVIHSTNPGPAGTTIWQGGARHLDVIIHQSEGFNGPVTLTAENLPAGLHFSPTTINNNSRGTFTLWADKNAAEWTGTVKLFATGKRGEETIRREVRPYTRVWTQDNSSRATRELALAIRPSAPFEMKFEKNTVEIAAGEKAEVKLQLTRHWPGFSNDVNISPLSIPGGFTMANGKFGGSAKEITLTIEVQNSRPIGDYTFSVLGQAQVPFSKDAAAKTRPNTLVSLPSQPITVRVIKK
jgi:hypothetical protein